MEIIINGKYAYIKKNSSFQFILENRLFTGSDSYSLTITFPLKGCPENIAIFGHINRQDVAKDKIVYDCEIRDRDFYKSGSITITEVNEVEIKTQFLEGRSEQNYDTTFDDIYLNELDLGYPENLAPGNYTMPDCLKPYPQVDWLCLPWVNNTSGNLQNEAEYNSTTGKYSWVNITTNRSFQPYLCFIIKKVCETQGYSCDIEDILQTDYKNLLVCNCLPAAWGAHNFAYALPHWSLTEFFEKLEYFLLGEFTINHKAKTVVFHFSAEEINNSGVEVLDSNIIDSYTTEIGHDDESSYIGRQNIEYAENGSPLWAYRSCYWYIKANKNKAVWYAKLADLLTFAKSYATSGILTEKRGTGTRTSYWRGYPPSSPANKLYYAADVDTYFIMYCYKTEFVTKHETATGDVFNWYRYYYRLEPVNQFGKLEVDEDADTVELDIVPAWIDDTEDKYGQCIFLECGQIDDASVLSDDGTEQTISGIGGGGHYGGGGGHFGGRR